MYRLMILILTGAAFTICGSFCAAYMLSSPGEDVAGFGLICFIAAIADGLDCLRLWRFLRWLRTGQVFPGDYLRYYDGERDLLVRVGRIVDNTCIELIDGSRIRRRP